MLDLDTYKKDFSTLPRFDMAWLEGYPYVRTPQGGRHYFFAPEEDIKMQTGVKGTKGVDIRTGKGSYVVIYGPKQNLYTMPMGLLKLLRNNMQITAKQLESDINTHFKVSMYLDKINADCDMNTWLAVLVAIKNLTGDKDLAWDWSSGSAGDEYKTASEEEFSLRYDSLSTKQASKLRDMRYLKRLANAG